MNTQQWIRTPQGLQLWVAGLPTPSGSRRVVPIRRKDGSQTYRLVADRRLADWIATVRLVAKQAMQHDPPWRGPVRVGLEFQFPRPKNHYRGGKPSPDRLRKDAPHLVAKRPDLDKLCRAVLDALTGVVWVDDAQVVRLQAIKYFDDPHGVLIVLDRYNI